MSARRPTLVLVSAPETLPGLEEALRAHRVRLVRIPVLDLVPRPAAVLRGAVKEFGPFDTLIVTSSGAVTAFVRPLSRLLRAQGPRLEVWAAGPSTARELRVAGVSRPRQAPEPGSASIVDALRRARPRTVVYPRSDRAGPSVARTLRRRGDRVLDLVAYAVRPRTRLTLREREALARSDAWIVTSPSAFSALRKALGSRGLRSLGARVPVGVLGERSRRAARGHGIRGARTVGGVTTQEITYYVSRWFEHGGGKGRRARASATTPSAPPSRRRARSGRPPFPHGP